MIHFGKVTLGNAVTLAVLISCAKLPWIGVCKGSVAEGVAFPVIQDGAWTTARILQQAKHGKNATKPTGKDVQIELMGAIKASNVNQVEALLKAGADANMRDERGDTPLIEAMHSFSINELTKVLVKHGAKVNATDSKGRVPLVEVIYHSHPRLPLTKFMLNKGADVNKGDASGTTPLIAAVLSADTQVMQALMDAGADVCAPGSDDRTALHFVAGAFGDASGSVKLLLRNGAKKDARDVFERTPLLLASRKGNFFIVKLLLEEGADVEAQDRDGRTPVIEAATWGHINTLKLLVRNGADVNHADNHGATATSEACQQFSRHRATCQYLSPEQAKQAMRDEKKNGNGKINFLAVVIPIILGGGLLLAALMVSVLWYNFKG